VTLDKEDVEAIANATEEKLASSLGLPLDKRDIEAIANATEKKLASSLGLLPWLCGGMIGFAIAVAIELLRIEHFFGIK
jgi:hypothetical protein